MPACSVSSRTAASRRRGPQHPEAPGRVGLGEQAGRERLARPGQRLDGLHPVTARGQTTDHGRLLGRRREARAREHRVDQRAIEHAGAFAAACLRAVHDRLLVGEQVARGEPPLTGVRGTVHVGAREELRGGALDRLGRCALAVGGRPRHHRLACRERVLPLGQPGRAGQLAAHQPQIRNLGRARRPARQRLELAGAEAVLGRPGAHDLLPRRGVDPVALALARVVRDRLTPRAPDLDASADELALALLDLPATRGELPQHLRGDLLDLGHPVAHRPPAHPRQPLTDRGAQVRLIQKPRRLGVLVDRRAIKRRPPAVRASAPCSRPPRACAAADPPRGSCDGDRPPPRTPPPPHAAHRRGRDARDTPRAPRNPTRHPRPPRAPQPAPGQHPIADREQDTDRLGRRERQVKRRHLRPPAHPSEPLARPRVAALHQRHEALPIDHADRAPEPPRPDPSNGPATRRARSSSHRGPAPPGARNSATARPSTCRSTAPRPVRSGLGHARGSLPPRGSLPSGLVGRRTGSYGYKLPLTHPLVQLCGALLSAADLACCGLAAGVGGLGGNRRKGAWAGCWSTCRVAMLPIGGRVCDVR